MSSTLRPEKLHVRFTGGSDSRGPRHPRCYTLTHSDRTGDLYLTIGPEIDRPQISGIYTRIMRDEVLAAWEHGRGQASLHLQLHVSGGLVLGSASWRDSIFRSHLKQVLESFRYGDRELYTHYPELDQATVEVHFNSSNSDFHRSEVWGCPGDYRVCAV
ncbi:MAG: staygreen family protein [Anaerolineales bacterium]|jgi:hypothetical protein